MGGHVAKVSRKDIEKKLRKFIVAKQNKLNYKFLEDKEFNNLFFIFFFSILCYTVNIRN